MANPKEIKSNQKEAVIIIKNCIKNTIKNGLSLIQKVPFLKSTTILMVLTFFSISFIIIRAIVLQKTIFAFFLKSSASKRRNTEC